MLRNITSDRSTTLSLCLRNFLNRKWLSIEGDATRTRRNLPYLPPK
jgi:hypothetical protein